MIKDFRQILLSLKLAQLVCMQLKSPQASCNLEDLAIWTLHKATYPRPHSFVNTLGSLLFLLAICHNDVTYMRILA